jgi:hypothetical protein
MVMANPVEAPLNVVQDPVPEQAVAKMFTAAFW